MTDKKVPCNLPFKPLVVVTYCDEKDEENTVPFRLWRTLAKFDPPFILDINGTKDMLSLINYWRDNLSNIGNWGEEQFDAMQFVKVHSGFTKWTDEDTPDARCMAGLMYLYRSHLIAPKIRQQGYTHLIWYTPRHSSLEDFKEVIQECRNSYARQEPILLFKHNRDGYPFTGAAYWFGFNFLTPEMVETNESEEYNQILEVAHV
jgi:hypothetical protein